MATAKTAIGIDLGTTYSCAAFFRNNKVEIIVNDQGNRITPSYVAFNDTERLVGDAAYNQAPSNPKNTIYGAKRLIGRTFSDKEVQQDIPHLPYKLVDKEGKPLIEVDAKGDTLQLSAEEVASMILIKLKERAEEVLEREVTDAVITVPAYFNDSQRQATKDAGIIAGLNVLRIINEPTAAAIAYGLNKLDDENDNNFMKRSTSTAIAVKSDKSSPTAKNILVYDLGGGTFDVSLLRIDRGVFEVKATNGDTHLGGEDFDNRLIKHFSEEFKRKHKKDVSTNENALSKLKRACETAKRTLSTASQAKIQIDSLVDGINFESSITKARFEELCSDLFKSTLEPLEQVLEDSKIEKFGVDEIILVGGSTRIPRVQKLVTEYFGGKIPNKSINPDEAVAYGAAVQASILVEDETSDVTADIVLVDVNPLSLGVKVTGDTMYVLIHRNSTVPTKKTQNYTTSDDNQEQVSIEVYEGERIHVSENNLLGNFTLTADVAAGVRGDITIQNESNRLTQEQIQKMIEDAEKFKEEDESEAARVKAQNELEQVAYGYLDTRNAREISEGSKAILKNACDETIEWLENAKAADTEEYIERIKYLEDLSAKLDNEGFGTNGDGPHVEDEEEEEDGPVILDE
ncbi:heat shock protein 70 [Scheffersomyces coipomensis]|uniref:heat shock protein 70 n=1 Tax=Scheffersomyces coipomensis TaxID=1788519 RepID=UPI00315D2CD5